MSWKTSWSVSVNGRDASSAMNDFLLSIEIDEKEGGGGDTATLELDDTGGRMTLPRAGARVVISLAGLQKFDGWTEEPEWDYARGGGRKISVHCVSHDTRGSIKDPQHWHQDGGSLSDFLTRAAHEAGLSSVAVAATFATIVRPWWSPGGASFLHLGERLANELGGVFKVRGGKAILAERGAGSSASGLELPAVVFDCSDETVASIKAKPFTGRESRSKAKATWFDRAAGKWRTEEVDIDPIDGAPASVAHGRYPRADGATAQHLTKGRKRAAAHDKGSVTVVADLRVNVPVGAPATVRNARAGVDGAWKVKNAKHHLDRGGGGKSTFDLGQPEGSAGKDTRASAHAATAKSGGTGEAGTAATSTTVVA